MGSHVKHPLCKIHYVAMKCVYGNTVFCGTCLGCKRGYEHGDRHIHKLPPAIWCDGSTTIKKSEVILFGP